MVGKPLHCSFVFKSLYIGFNALMLAILNENVKNIKLLVQSGCSINLEELYSTPCLAKQLSKYPEIERILWNERTRAKNLKELCRLRIRSSLGQRLWKKTSSLPLPSRLKDYVALKEFFTSYEEQQQMTLTRIPHTNVQAINHK
jgi:hypothetical protein